MASKVEDITPTLPGPDSGTPKEKILTASIQTAPRYEVGDPVECEITITNNADEDYYLLARETPLEGLRSDIFTVSKGRKLMPYDGIVLKRGAPTTSEFTLIKAKSEWKGTVDISTAYYFTSAGTYTMHLNMDATFGKERSPESTQVIVSNTAMFELLRNGKPPTKGSPARKEKPQVLHKRRASSVLPISPILAGDYRNDEDRRKTKDAYNKAYTAIRNSITSVQNGRGPYEEWFGNRISRYLRRDNTREVSSNYEKMRNKMEVEVVTLYAELGTDCFAYVRLRDFNEGLPTIYLCKQFFIDKDGNDTDISGTDSMMGTIVHEMSHGAAGIKHATVDGVEMYGQDYCRYLARNYSKKARNNADNYEYFAEAQPQTRS